MISAAQIRAARALLGLDVDELSARTGLSATTVTAIESGGEKVPDQAAHLALRQHFEAMGVTFFGAGDCPAGGEGLRLTTRHDAEDGVRPENLNATNDD